MWCWQLRRRRSWKSWNRRGENRQHQLIRQTKDIKWDTTTPQELVHFEVWIPKLIALPIKASVSLSHLPCLFACFYESVSCVYVFFSTCLSTCVARAACLVFCSMFLTIFLFSFFLFYKFNSHLCHGAYCCTHNPAHMPILLCDLHLYFSNSCVCVPKHVYAFPSLSQASTPRGLVPCWYTCGFMFKGLYFSNHPCLLHMYFSCSVLYLWRSFCFLSSFSANLIDTYVTVPSDAFITLLINLSSASFCISILVIHTYVHINLYTHFPPLSYSYTFIAIFTCIYVSTIM